MTCILSAGAGREQTVMRQKRDDFSVKVKHLIEKKSAYRCSNPACRRMTIGPSEDFKKIQYLGVVSHICAAAPGGPRYDPAMSPEERAGEENGLLLCRYCAALIDTDETAYPPQLLRTWRETAYRLAAEDLAAPADGMADSRCWGVIRRLVRACLCAYRTEGRISPAANLRSCAGTLYRLLFEELPGQPDYKGQQRLWSETVGAICADCLEPVACRVSSFDRGFPRHYRILMEELGTYPIQVREQRAQILNHMESELRELFRTGEALGLNRKTRAERG